ncbi:MAG: hypothetical protein E7615_00380 [Ruminococcaceae bacterium]|nr:hypothetical protein [Oscillospiraceae bacterium]
MCNIAGYVGTKNAAPILLEMMMKEEGFCAGYYAGIATIDGGKIYYEKLVGHTQMLIDEKNAQTLPGNIGICHGRSRGSGGQGFAHPFVTEVNGETVSAYIANGNNAPFTDLEENKKYAEYVKNAGYEMKSLITDYPKEKKTNYPRFDNGDIVHISDVLCQGITKHVDEGMTPPKAMEKTFIELPSELVGLYLHRDHPDSIAWARTNMPIFIAFADHGTYIASAPTAFPDDAGDPIPLLPYTYGTVSNNFYTTSSFSEKKGKIAPLDSRVRTESYKAVIESLKEGPKDYKTLLAVIAPIFDSADVIQGEVALNEVLYSLERQGKVKIDPVFSNGPYGPDVPKNIMTLI